MINSVPVLVLFLELELKYKIMVLKLFLVPVLRTGTTLFIIYRLPGSPSAPGGPGSPFCVVRIKYYMNSYSKSMLYITSYHVSMSVYAYIRMYIANLSSN